MCGSTPPFICVFSKGKKPSEPKKKKNKGEISFNCRNRSNARHHSFLYESNAYGQQHACHNMPLTSPAHLQELNDQRQAIFEANSSNPERLLHQFFIPVHNLVADQTIYTQGKIHYVSCGTGKMLLLKVPGRTMTASSLASLTQKSWSSSMSSSIDRFIFNCDFPCNNS